MYLKLTHHQKSLRVAGPTFLKINDLSVPIQRIETSGFVLFLDIHLRAKRQVMNDMRNIHLGLRK